MIGAVFMLSLAFSADGSMRQTQPTNQAIVIDCQKHTVTPYGALRKLTMAAAGSVGKQVVVSYKLDNPLPDRLVLVASYTEWNIACGASAFHRQDYVGPQRYEMTRDTIGFTASPPDWVSGDVLLRIFLVREKALANRTYMADSNVVSLRLRFQDREEPEDRAAVT